MIHFLVSKDYNAFIRSEILSIVGQDDPDAMAQAEQAAIIEISSYLKERYDVSKIYPTIYEFDLAQTYAAGDIVHDPADINGGIYTCVQQTTNNPLTNTTYFSTDDPRNKLIIQHTVTIALHTLYTSAAPHKIPEMRVKMYDDTIAWLYKVNMGKLSPDLPLYDPATGSADDIPWGSNPKFGHGY